ncbi:helix-turn-helix domain-containing protein [Sutterella megalosphaeroides]|uniref:HTH cro/C1-type domain-containing protein n=1 Tax=Sutterella megalosphaeroides TaxID=2494234 RepID=A0A2Z6I758_9BURK|nr:XRE family transcriptional regulator [Sutterella megalosphaeroides]BBF22213.1 hypothetical protein SUTMEG_01040 [Sutterella megalosphaeroides]
MTTTLAKQRQSIGARLAEERRRLGYSERQIAQLLGVPLDVYVGIEAGEADPGIYRMPRLVACGFDILYILTAERHLAVAEESELLARFRELSHRGRTSIFTTLDALERLAPNLRRKIKDRFR